MTIYDKINIQLLIFTIVVILLIIYIINRNKSSFTLDDKDLPTTTPNTENSEKTAPLDTTTDNNNDETDNLDEKETEEAQSLKWSRDRYIRNRRSRGLRYN